MERQLRRQVPPELLPSFEQLPWVLELHAAKEIGHLAAPGAGALAADQLARLEHIIRALSRRDTLRELFGQILDALVLWTGVERGLLLLTAPGGALRIRAARGLVSGDLTADQRALSMTLARRALARREPVVAVDARGELPELSESVHALNLRSVLAAPLLARGEALGVVYLDDRDRRAAFGEAERAWVRLLASVAAIAIAEARDQLALRRAAQRAERAATRLERELRAERGKPPSAERAHPELVGSSPAMTQLIERIRKVAETELPVLILGESGSGKELVARAIHQDSPRAARALVVENCAAVPETLLESTLFGHVRGAFTGADRARPGLFELADGGTLFLDEVGEMSLGMQAKLLRVLESGEVRAVGSSRTQRVDVRVIAATHRDLVARVREGSFREDLLYRLDVLSLRVPPLRERKQDIRELAAHFIARSPSAARLSPAALRLLEAYPWPGNVRQLENELLRALVLGGDPLTPEHFSAELSEQRAPDSDTPNPTLKEAMTRLQRRLLEEALTAAHGNQSEAARRLGVSRYGLQKMLRRLEAEDG
ncbi:MAG: sigma 54-interacting transcriptional regulator [Polyangiaceae bacterium]|nr:sigma 54-interacting transcriptional regulator [Polyangiaceae bacterium]